MWGSLGVMKGGLDMLMDAAIEPEYLAAVEKAVADQPELAGHHFLKTRRSGKQRFVETHVVFKDPALPLYHAHAVGDRVEAAIEAAVPGAVVTLHLDPCDDSQAKGCPVPASLKDGRAR
jgi:divalent metal cation (Fe/Co/Zn/Cd) transporter